MILVISLRVLGQVRYLPPVFVVGGLKKFVHQRLSDVEEVNVDTIETMIATQVENCNHVGTRTEVLDPNHPDKETCLEVSNHTVILKYDPIDDYQSPAFQDGPRT